MTVSHEGWGNHLLHSTLRRNLQNYIKIDLLSFRIRRRIAEQSDDWWQPKPPKLQAKVKVSQSNNEILSVFNN